MNTKIKILFALTCSIATFAPAIHAQWKGTAPSTQVEAGADIAIVKTGAGTVQGSIHGSIYNFRGIPYAKAGRFEAPVQPDAWEGVRYALSYGNICPQVVGTEIREPQAFTSNQRYWPQSENCLNLNVWTPAPDQNKRPVMVWFHGGGFTNGSSIELPAYDGSNLSGLGDVVVVTVNHRLNILGFLDLSAYGSDYASSGNVGLADLVASLEWVRDNIAAFGGDPDNVTIFGQSGGGAKVSSLLGAPSARGLFDKAIVMSGAMGPARRPNGSNLSQRVAELVFNETGIKPGDIAALQALPYEQLEAAGAKALAQVSREVTGAPAGGPLGFPVINWGPVADGQFLPEMPFADGAPAISATVPLMVGSTLSEFQRINPRIKGHEAWSEKQLRNYLAPTYADNVDALLAAFRKAYPALPLSEVVTIDSGARAGALGMAAAKAAQPAPVYNYLFAYRAPVLDYSWAAGHTTDVPFIFNNAEAGIRSSGGGPVVDQLTNVMALAWINFARSGNPNHQGMSEWPPFTTNQPTTMVFDVEPRARVGHDAELIKLLAAPAPRR
ncbi:MAG: carboxylesterase/lipase family protein [Gammaproteobacteria bacterium]|nr:carboxylesterase/lipase family protein [Gammaproteobacteria bacterium]